MIMTADKLIISKASLDVLKTNYFAYLDVALADARSFVVGANPHAVHTYFGALDAVQRTTLIDGLKKLKKVAKNYTVNGRSNERKIQWSKISGTELHSGDQYAKAYPYGVTDINKHFALRIYAGMLLANQSYDWKVNTMYHELSHRVLATADVTHHLTGNATAYGLANVRALTGAPVEALRNASNWAYYINNCNGQTNGLQP